MNKIFQHLLSFTIPFLFLVIAYVTHASFEILPVSWINAMPLLTVTLFALAIVLGIWFNRGSIVFTSIVLLFLCYNQAEGLGFSDNFISADQPQHTLILIVGISNLLFFSFSTERGVFSFWGKIKLTALAFQGWLLLSASKSLSTDLDRLLLEHVSFPLVKKMDVQTFSLILLTGTIFILAIKAIRTGSFTDRSMVTSVLIIAIIIFMDIPSETVPIFYATIGLLLILSVISSSYHMAYIDELTQIPSRRALEEKLLQLGNHYTIAMLDIDFFKKFNDRYGHDVGDDVLAMVASVLKNVESGGKAYRYGGEEFTIVFPGKGLTEILPVLDELRKTIAQQTYLYKPKPMKKPQKRGSSRGKNLRVTISIGVAEKNHRFKTPEEVRTASDKALYRAKKKGRNCVSK
ncbi:GGDEF domain-containing protein [Tindallia californiensis]|uniref:Diguanylate cyclase (GGDEF) domain-containing protein n=1 Tax=Tindallia californiensis TaxID=159292 RepID=A0A1H3LCQ0_9FIRM|nr:GGDEF domain-containing protein [Tindallia californiensis]SDY61724.1 diguanylate cyclase (GGDEF) domain-containing protein [Tindallia californiensis]